MRITWKYIKPLDNPNAVRDFLKAYNILLPEEVIKIIEKCNGGRPSDRDIVTRNKKEHVFKSLLSYNKTDSETIYSVFPEQFKETSLFPIGTDPAGNFICFDIKRKIYCFYDHETGYSDEITGMFLISKEP